MYVDRLFDFEDLGESANEVSDEEHDDKDRGSDVGSKDAALPVPSSSKLPRWRRLVEETGVSAGCDGECHELEAERPSTTTIATAETNALASQLADSADGTFASASGFQQRESSEMLGPRGTSCPVISLGEEHHELATRLEHGGPLNEAYRRRVDMQQSSITGSLGSVTALEGICGVLADLQKSFPAIQSPPAAKPAREHVAKDSCPDIDDLLLDDCILESDVDAKSDGEEDSSTDQESFFGDLAPERPRKSVGSDFFSFRGESIKSSGQEVAPLVDTGAKRGQSNITQVCQTESKRAVYAFGLSGLNSCSDLVRSSSSHRRMTQPSLPPLDQAACDEGGKKDDDQREGIRADDSNHELQQLYPRVNFRIRDEVLPMLLPEGVLTPQEIAQVWEKDWGCRGGARLKFGATLASPSASGSKWLHPRNDAVHCVPDEAVGHDECPIHLEGPGSILDAVSLALRRRWQDARSVGDTRAHR